MIVRAAFASVVVGAGALLASMPAEAFVPHEASAGLEIPLPRETPRGTFELREDGSDRRMTEFASRWGGRWLVDWNEITGTPHLIMGSGAKFSGPISTAEEAGIEARRLIELDPEIFRAGLSELAIVQTTEGMGKWSVFFSQNYRGIPVEGGSAQVTFTREGELMVLGSDLFAVRNVATVPALTEAQAVEIAARPVGYDGVGDEVTEAALVVLPLELPGGVAYRLTYRVGLRVDDPLGNWVSYVDAEDGTIHGRYDRIRYAAVTGSSRGEIQFVGYCDGEYLLPTRNMTITVTGQGSGLTDENGNWSVDVTGDGPFIVNAEFLGPWVNVNVTDLPDASFSAEGAPGIPLDIFWDDGNSRQDERDAFYNVNVVHDRVKEVDPGFTGTDYEMPCTVNIDDYCNAYWDGSGVNFFREGGGCANTAEIGNVVYHEYGHGVTDMMYYSDPPSDIHEGNSDVLACYLENNPIVGSGFHLGECSTGLRNLDNALRYPDDLQGEGHYDGQILGGFYWDAREYLMLTEGEEAGSDIAWDVWHFGRKLGLPRTQPDQVYYAFVADDDDADLTNGTPHFNELCQAARNHGFSCPGEALVGATVIEFALDALWSTVDTSRVHEVRSGITSSAAPIDPDSVMLYYRVDEGPLVELSMTFDPGSGKYAATIPPMPRSSTVEYYLLAVDEAGNRRTEPLMAPYELWAFDVGYLYDPAETDTGWQLGAPGDDATTGTWQRCDPERTSAQPEDDHTPSPGTDAFITWCDAGSGLGSYDVDGGKTTLTSPVFNVAGLDNVRIKYFRWYTNDTGATPGTDFWVADVSNDGGASWTNVENTNLSGHSWQEIVFPLTDYFVSPGQVQMRFIASDEGDGSLVEAGLDDFTILADAGSTSDVEVAASSGGIPGSYRLHQNNPNPFNPATTISYDMPRKSRVSLKVYDVAGREVRTLVSATQPAGSYAFVWDGTDAAGLRAASGVYFYRLTADDFSATQKMILTK